MGSTRLPGKVLMELQGTPALSWVIRAARASAIPAKIVVATTLAPADNAVADVAISEGVEILRGDSHDVLNRFVQVIDEFGDAPIVRLTADCPLLDPALIRAACELFNAVRPDYVSTFITRCLPRGLDVEVVSVEALRACAMQATGADRAHVTSYLYRNPGLFTLVGMLFLPKADHFRVTLDTPEDALALVALTDLLGNRPPSYQEVISVLKEHPHIASMNSHVRQKDIDQG